MQSTTAVMPFLDYELKPLTLKQVEEIENWMRKILMDAVRDTVIDSPDALGSAIEKLSEVSFFSSYGSRMLMGRTGLVKLFTMSCDEMTQQLAFELLQFDDNVKLFTSLFMEMNQPKKRVAKTDEGESPKKPAVSASTS